MPLYTKSIAAKPTKKDGIRVCIMRHPDSWAKYDIWMPQLSPSQKLRDKSKQERKGFEIFSTRFLKELKKNTKYLDFVAEAAKKQTVTIMCIEENPLRRHRSIVAKEIKKRHPNLKVIIR